MNSILMKINSFRENKPVVWNMLIFALAMVISQTAIETFNVTSTLYALNNTGQVWMAALVQILRYLPTLIAFAVAPLIIKKFNHRTIIIVSEIISSILLFIAVFVAIFTLNKPELKNAVLGQSPLIITIYIVVILWNVFNAGRFLALKQIVYRISQDEKQINTYNRINNFATSISYLVAAVASLGFVKLIGFQWSTLILAIAYLISAALYRGFKLLDKEVEISSKPQIIRHSKTLIYTFTILVVLALFSAITFVPRFGTNTQFVTNLFLETKNSANVETWVSIYLIVIGVGLCLGSIVIFLLGKKILITTSILFAVVSIALFIFLLFAFGGFKTNIGLFGSFDSNSNLEKARAILSSQLQANIDKGIFAYTHQKLVLGIFLLGTFIQYFLFSMFLPVYFDYSYRTIPKEKYAFFAGITMIIFQFMGLVYSITMITLFNKTNYQFSYLFFVVIILVFVGIAVIAYLLLRVRQAKKVQENN